MPVVAALVVGAVVGSVAGTARGDESAATEEIEHYLEDLRLHSLLAAYLERRLDREMGRERTAVAEELARVYARLLEDAGGADEQRRWEDRARTLLVVAPEADSLELRIGLLRASFKRSEEVVEKWRLRMVGRDEVVGAVERLRELIGRFDDVAGEAHRRVRSLEKQEESAPDSSAELLAAALGEARRQRSLAHYLAGWAACHVGEAEEDAAVADAALTHFGWLLNAKMGARAELDRVPDQMLRYSHVARAAIAVAVCQSIRGYPDIAGEWLDRVEGAEEPAEGMLEQVFSRRMEVLARGQLWRELEELVAVRRGGREAGAGAGVMPLTTGDARLLAVISLEARPVRDSEIVERLRDVGLSDLVARGELGHVLELASLYGAERFGEETFVSQQVRGLISYDAAREAHRALGVDEGEPVEDAEVGRRYMEAARLFEHAARASDAVRYETALGNTMMLIGLCRYYAGGSPEASARDAARWFVEAAARVPESSRAADALWLAIRTYDMEIERGGDEDGELASARDVLIDRFLEEHPEHERAAALTLRLAMGGGIAPRRAIELLLAVPEGSGLYETARKQAARLSYDLYRKATSGDRDWRALRYMELEEPLLAADRRRASAGDRASAEEASVRARRIAEAAMAMSVPDADRAERALDVLVSLISAGLIEGEELRAEVMFRRAQVAIERGDEALASSLVEELSGQSETLASAGRRMVYRHALNTWRRLRRGDAGSDGALAAARRVVLHGLPLVEELASGEGVVRDAGVVSLCLAVGDASADLALEGGDRDRGALAMTLYRRVLEGHPSLAATHRRHAAVAEMLGRYEDALSSWRTLLAGLESGSAEWFEAKSHQVRVLERVDVARAREVLAQLAVLYPGFGPEPWSKELAAMHARLVGDGGRGGR